MFCSLSRLQHKFVQASVGGSVSIMKPVFSTKAETIRGRYFHSRTFHDLQKLVSITTETKSLKHAAQLHSQIITNDLPSLFNALLTLYSKCGAIAHSLLLFSTAHHVTKNVVSWTSLISNLSHFNRHFQALHCFAQMRRAGVHPNHFTFSAVLPACATTGVLSHGHQVHSLICKYGYGSYLFVGSALVDMYSKCGDLDSADKVFVGMPERNLVSWNTMIVGCLSNELFGKGLWAFREVMRASSLLPDQVTFSSVSSACASMGGSKFGRQVHGVVVKYGLEALPYVSNSLMDMYFKCRLFHDGAVLFSSLGKRDVVSWNVMAMGCVCNEAFEEACNYFWVMRREGISLDEASYSTALHASANTAALNQGSSVHNQVIKDGYSKNICVASSLITMYAKCGSLHDAYQVFQEIRNPNVVCWTAIIAACQQHGRANRALQLFERMLKEGEKPNYITFVSVVSACSHTGRVEEGYAHFKSMMVEHDINPNHENYASVVDLFCRVGRLDEAMTFVESMPIKPHSSVWGSLLAACANYGNIEMGHEAAKRLFELEPNNPGNYVLLSNMYTRRGKLKEADEVRRLMGINGVQKEPGCSWISLKDQTFVFIANDRSHSQTNEIYEILQVLEESMKKEGYLL